MRTSWFVRGAMAAVLLFAVGACGSGTGGKTLTIANFDPFSGPDASYGFTEQAGCVPAVNLINRAGGLFGRQLRCQIVDGRGDPADAGPAAQKLLRPTPDPGAVGDANRGRPSAPPP